MLTVTPLTLLGRQPWLTVTPLTLEGNLLTVTQLKGNHANRYTWKATTDAAWKATVLTVTPQCCWEGNHANRYTTDAAWKATMLTVTPLTLLGRKPC